MEEKPIIRDMVVATAFDRGLFAGRSFSEATIELRSAGHDSRLVDALAGSDVRSALSAPHLFRAAELRTGMKLDQEFIPKSACC